MMVERGCGKGNFSTYQPLLKCQMGTTIYPPASLHRGTRGTGTGCRSLASLSPGTLVATDATRR